MESWLVTIISLIGSTAVTTIIGLIIKHYFKKYLAAKEIEDNNRREQELELAKFREEQQRKERKADIMLSIEEAIKPLENKIDALDKKLDKVEDGTLSTLRNDILTCYYRCVEKGYRNDYDYQNIHHMYESYADLNGNSYVADVMNRFDELPAKEDAKEITIGKARKAKGASSKK